jgi:hypothetical protein
MSNPLKIVSRNLSVSAQRWTTYHIIRKKKLLEDISIQELGILSSKILLRQHDNGNLIVATMKTITTMKNPNKITQNGDI